jgi:mannose-1-phosphate guanylyltransferase
MASAAYWLDTGTPEAYLQASFDILGGLRGLPPLPDAREVSAGVWVRGDVSIQGEVGRPSLVCQGGVVEAGASVAGAVVGEGCRVEKGAVLRRSVMLAGSVLCRDASVTDSIVGPGAVVLEGARISSTSIVGPGVRVAAGSVVEGARLAREDG